MHVMDNGFLYMILVGEGLMSCYVFYAVILSRILQMLAPSGPPSHPPSGPPIHFSSRTMKLAKAYCGEPEKELISNPINLSSTLEKLYAWEKKLYKEVKV